MGKYLKTVFFYLSFFLIVGGIALMALLPNTLGKFESDSMPPMFWGVFGGMCLLVSFFVAIRWFDAFDDAEFLSPTAIKIIGLVAAVGMCAVQGYIRIAYNHWNFFGGTVTIPNFETLETADGLLRGLIVLHWGLTGITGFCFFSQALCGGEFGGKYVVVTTYYTDSGFAYDQKTSDPYTAVWGYILVGLLTTILPYLISFTPFALGVALYWLLLVLKHKSTKAFVLKSVVSGLLTVALSVPSLLVAFGVPAAPVEVLTYKHYYFKQYEKVWDYYNVSDGEGEKTSFTGAVVIPATYAGKEVRVESNAFSDNLNVFSVTLMGSVELGEKCFKGCANLQTIGFWGTKEEWNRMKKGGNWTEGVPATEVRCSDGTVQLN